MFISCAVCCCCRCWCCCWFKHRAESYIFCSTYTHTSNSLLTLLFCFRIQVSKQISIQQLLTDCSQWRSCLFHKARIMNAKILQMYVVKLTGRNYIVHIFGMFCFHMNWNEHERVDWQQQHRHQTENSIYIKMSIVGKMFSERFLLCTLWMNSFN